MIKLPPPNPPGPDSPLPAWQHYEITQFANLAIQKKLPTNPIRKEFLIGLEVRYFVALDEGGEETSYAMPFGKVVPTLDEKITGRTVLSREFLDRLYNQVDTYVRKNVLKPYIVTNVILQVRTNKVLYLISCGCRTIGGTYLGKPVKCGHSPKHSGKRWCCLSNGVWRCKSKC